MVAFYVAPTEDLARNPGMCPDWESNPQPFGSQPTLNLLSYTSQGPSINIFKRAWEIEFIRTTGAANLQDGLA